MKTQCYTRQVPGVGIIIGTAQILFSLIDKSGEEYINFVATERYEYSV